MEIYCQYLASCIVHIFVDRQIELNGAMWSWILIFIPMALAGKRGSLSPMCNKEELILLRIRTTHCCRLLSLSRILSLSNIVKVLRHNSQQNQSISNCDISVTVSLLTLTFLPSCSGAIKISWCGNGKYFLMFIVSIFQMTRCILCFIVDLFWSSVLDSCHSVLHYYRWTAIVVLS